MKKYSMFFIVLLITLSFGCTKSLFEGMDDYSNSDPDVLAYQEQLAFMEGDQEKRTEFANITLEKEEVKEVSDQIDQAFEENPEPEDIVDAKDDLLISNLFGGDDPEATEEEKEIKKQATLDYIDAKSTIASTDMATADIYASDVVDTLLDLQNDDGGNGEITTTIASIADFSDENGEERKAALIEAAENYKKALPDPDAFKAENQENMNEEEKEEMAELREELEDKYMGAGVASGVAASTELVDVYDKAGYYSLPEGMTPMEAVIIDIDGNKTLAEGVIKLKEKNLTSIVLGVSDGNVNSADTEYMERLSVTEQNAQLRTITDAWIVAKDSSIEKLKDSHSYLSVAFDVDNLAEDDEDKELVDNLDTTLDDLDTISEEITMEEYNRIINEILTF